MKPLRTERQQSIYDFCVRHKRETGIYPSYSTICQHFGLRSKATVAKHMDAIARQGFALPISPKPGSLRLVNEKQTAKTTIYYGSNWARQKSAARKRDDYRCQRCGIVESESSGRLHVHHIRPFRAFKDYREANRLQNLVTLCNACHCKVEPRPKVHESLAALAEGKPGGGKK